MTSLSSVKVAAAGTLAVGGLAFTLSFNALEALAADNGVSVTWMLPLVVDGGVIVATAATLALRQRRWFAWALLILSSGVSVAGNVAHASETSGTPIAMVLAGIPALWLLAACHLTVMLVNQGQDGRPETEVEVPRAPALVPV